MSDWTDHKTIEELLQMRSAYPASAPTHREAHEAILRLEAEQTKKDSDAANQIAAQRHQESVELDRASVAESKKANRIAWIAIAIAVIGWWFPRSAIQKDSGNTNALPASLPSRAGLHSAASYAPQMTNASTNKPAPQAPPPTP